MEVKVAVSARHIHLTKEDVDILFGKDYKLNKRNDLSQIGQYACLETVIIKTQKSELNLRVLGPTRNYTQVEVSRTDAYKLGINPPVRNSGDIIGSEKVTIIGPKGIIENKECCIIADRHKHMNNMDALKYELNDGDIVKVKINGLKGGIMNNVHIRVSDNFVYEMHIDTDDANAFLLNGGEILEVLK